MYLVVQRYHVPKIFCQTWVCFILQKIQVCRAKLKVNDCAYVCDGKMLFETCNFCFTVYRESEAGCEGCLAGPQYSLVATYIFGRRTHHFGRHWSCLYIVAAVSVRSRSKLQVSLFTMCRIQFCYIPSILQLIWQVFCSAVSVM